MLHRKTVSNHSSLRRKQYLEHMTLEREVKDWKSDGMDGETESARVQDEVDQEASKHNEADGMKRSSDPEIGSACTDAREKER